ncbi:BatD family protein [Thiomicrospira sp. ALE5]|uniref:BatD family protein n=1 Tax=Thiomicrospira sp. ALE5 TaxID=748650 RepID=UPI0008EAD008|nr:BatD family protein [Thiomicrospira sp. ALE5]SFR56689.1 Oxygen tolerance [Thiomicrospira sp. ALE5]
MVKLGLFFILSMLMIPVMTYANWSDRMLVTELEAAKVNKGDVVNISVLANFQTTTRGPDFSVLMDDFEILSRQASSQLRVINGTPTGTTLWEVALMPKRTGVIDIPSFSVEDIKSNALSVEVLDLPALAADYPITFMTAEISSNTPYIQEEVLYTLRLHYLGSLRRGSVDMPVFNDFLSERIVNQNQFETLVDDRLYRVIEWVYAIYPQKSGDLTIQPMNFEGALLRQRQIELFEASSNSVTLNVKPIPDSFPIDASWLPARQINLKQDWQITGAFKVGDTLSRRLTIEAIGLQASQLPNPKFEEQPGVRIYADPAGQNQHTSQRGISSSKQQVFTAVFQQPGEIELAEISIPWWNTVTDSLEYTRINARKVTVLPGDVTDTPLPEWVPEGLSDQSSTGSYWPFLSAMLLILWLGTLGLWYRQRLLLNQHPIQKTDLSNTPPKTSQMPSLEKFKALSVLEQGLWLKKWWQLQGLKIATMPHQAPKLYKALQRHEALKYGAQLPDDKQLNDTTEQLYYAILDWHESNQSSSKIATKALAELYPT